jgi:hypothetical protein
MRTGAISEALVEETWLEVGGMTDMVEAANLSKKFSKAQPALASFLLEFSRDLSRDAHELAFYMGLVIWRCYEKAAPSRLRKLSEKDIIERHEAFEAELGALVGTDDRMIERKVLHSKEYPQPAILKYIVETLYEENDSPEAVPLTDDEKGELFIIMKVAADCLETVYS